jgi:hypothetical protein
MVDFELPLTKERVIKRGIDEKGPFTLVEYGDGTGRFRDAEFILRHYSNQEGDIMHPTNSQNGNPKGYVQ